MKKILFLLILIFPIIVLGYNDTLNPMCTLSEKSKLRNASLNFNYVLEKYKNEDEILYKVTILNMIEDIVIDYNNETYTIENNIIEGIIPGTVMSFKIYSNPNSVCDGFNISSKVINIPYYNVYKDNDLCIGNEEYFLCKENVNTKISEEEFIKKINSYIEEKNNKKEIEEEPTVIKEEKLSNILLDWFLDYYIYISFSIITLGTIGIILLVAKKKKELY
ncbi:MAG: hypothetical protein GX032_00155 [Tenericutes bacterium]|nr:hypothetical protein [Mycoplasmatota bacterium]